MFYNKSSPVHISVEAVVIGDQFILPLVVQLALQVHVLQVGQVRLVPRQGDGGHVHHVFAGVVVKDLKKKKSCNNKLPLLILFLVIYLGDVGMNLKIIEEYLISSQSVQELYPLC